MLQLSFYSIQLLNNASIFTNITVIVSIFTNIVSVLANRLLIQSGGTHDKD